MAGVRMSEGVEWSLHSCWLLAVLGHDRSVTARRLAEFHGVPEAYLTKILKSLVDAGILTSSLGPRGGFRLARDPGEITVLEVVDAVEGPGPAFRCTEIRQRGPAALSSEACRRPCGIAVAMLQAEDAWRRALAARTVADLVASAATHSRSRATRWARATLPQ